MAFTAVTLTYSEVTRPLSTSCTLRMVVLPSCRCVAAQSDMAFEGANVVIDPEHCINVFCCHRLS